MPYKVIARYVNLCRARENRVVGVAGVSNFVGPVWFLDQIAVLPEYRGQGVGTRLVNEIVSYVRAKGERRSQRTNATSRLNLNKKKERRVRRR